MKKVDVKKICVGNLPSSAQEDQLRDLFRRYGAVRSVSITVERETGGPTRFAFVEIDSEVAGRLVAELDGRDFGGRPLRVYEAERGRPAGKVAISAARPHGSGGGRNDDGEF